MVLYIVKYTMHETESKSAVSAECICIELRKELPV